MDNTSNCLCRLPWTGFSIEANGQTRACCIAKSMLSSTKTGCKQVQTDSMIDILHSDSLVKLRDDMRNTRYPAECATCWNDEKLGYESKRLAYLKTASGDQIDWASEPTKVSELQVVLNNSCNIKCRTCGPFHSTKWISDANALKWFAQAELEIPTFVQGYAGDEDGVFWKNRADWYKTIDRLEIMGGEPLYVKQWHTVFDELISANLSSKVVISMSTNCTLYYPELMDKICANFKYVDIAMSVDGTGSVFEYMRHPAKWNIALENMKRYAALRTVYPNFFTKITYTISWLNALELINLHNLLGTNIPNLLIWHNIVQGPDHFALWAIPVELKDAIATRLSTIDHPDIAGIIKFMYSRSITEEQFMHNLSTIRRVDSLRKEDLLSMIPELAQYLSQRWDIITNR